MTAATALYPARQIKRHRATAAEMETRYDALLAIVEVHQPMTVRQVFYQATVRGIIDKTEGGYDKICTALVRGVVPKRPPIGSGGVLDRSLDAAERAGLAHPSRVVGDPVVARLRGFACEKANFAIF